MRTPDEWRALLRDRAAWDTATQSTDDAEEALTWLTDVIADIEHQMSNAKADIAGQRLPDDDYRDLMAWRAAANGFKRICAERKRKLVTRLKHENQERSEASAVTALARLRRDINRLCDEWEDEDPHGHASGLLAEFRALVVAS